MNALPSNTELAQWLRRGAPDCGAPETHKVWCEAAATRLVGFSQPTQDEAANALADEIERSNGLLCMNDGTPKVRQLGIKKTAQVIAALRKCDSYRDA